MKLRCSTADSGGSDRGSLGVHGILTRAAGGNHGSRHAGAGHDFEGTDGKGGKAGAATPEPVGARAEFPNPQLFPGNLISRR